MGGREHWQSSGDRGRGARIALKRIALALGATLGLSSCVSTNLLKIDSFTLASSGLCDPGYSNVQKSQCLWVATGESIGLQWDVDICASDNDNGNPAQFSKRDGDQPNRCDQSPMNAGSAPACSYVNACYEGRLNVNGDDQGLRPWGSQYAPATILGCSVAESFNPLNECRALTQNCRPVPHQGCFGANPPVNYPYCSKGCMQQIDQDESLELDPGPPDQPIRLPPPTFYTVTETRRIVRSGQYDADASDVDSGQLVWSYQVPVDANGVLEENFSPTLFISKVRAFTGDPTTTLKQHLSLLKVKVDGGARVNCGGAAADTTEVTADSCPNLGRTTPASVDVATPSGQAIIWRVTALDGAHGGIAGLTRSSEVYIAFTLANSKGGGGQLYISPSLYDFGVVASGVQRTDQGVLKLHLDSPKDWVVESISTSGNNAQEFSLQVEGDGHIGAGGTRNIGVTFNPASDGRKRAAGTITLRDPGGVHVNVSADLYATSGAQPLLVAPDTIRYYSEFDQNGQPFPLPWRKRFFIQNAGVSPIVRESAVIGGADAAAFHIYEGRSGNSPVAPSFTIGTGDSEIFSVEFCPTRHGSFSAQATVTANEGTAAAPAIVAGTVTLEGTAPDAPAALCP